MTAILKAPVIKTLTDFYTKIETVSKKTKEEKEDEKKPLTEEEEEEAKKKKKAEEEAKKKAKKAPKRPKKVIQKEKLPWAPPVDARKRKKYNNTDAMNECLYEIRAFRNGGTPGLYQLQRVLANIFKHYGVTSSKEQESVMLQADLKVYTHDTTGSVQFVFDSDQ